MIETITIPGRVWEDYLDPLVSGMQAELELPNPEHRKVGKGSSVTYRDVAADTAKDLAVYLNDRGATLLDQSVSDPYDPFEKAERDTHRAAVKAARRIWIQLEAA